MKDKSKKSHSKSALSAAAVLGVLASGHASAKADDLVAAKSIEGVEEVKKLSDGSVELVFENGQVARVSADQVVVKDGEVYIQEDAVIEVASSAVLPAAASGLSTGAAIGTAAAIGGVAAAASGGGGGGDDEVIAPVLEGVNLLGGPEDDNLIGTEADDIIDGRGGNDNIEGLGGNDLLVGGPGADNIVAGAGDDILRGGGGSDVTDGGEGVDTADFSDIGSAVTASLDDNEAVYLAPNGNTITDELINIENLRGSNNDDELTGDSNNNVLTGGFGNDSLNGGSGVDSADFSDSDAEVIIDVDAEGNGTVSRDAEVSFSISVEDQAVESLTTEQSPAEIVDEAVAGNLYFNIHTVNFPGGEIRGQLDTIVSDVTDEAGVRTITLSAVLNAAQEPGPTSTSVATGEGTVVLVVAEDGSVTYSTDLTVNGIPVANLLPVAGVSSIHLHNAPAGVNGPVILDVVQDAGGDVNGIAVDPSFDSGDGNVFVENIVSETDTLESIEVITNANGNGAIIVADDVELVNDNVIDGAVNGVNFLGENATVNNNAEGVITSDSRAVDIGASGATLNNQGLILGTADQRNGTVYVDGDVDNVAVNNNGIIDAGEGNQGSGFGVEVDQAEDGANTFELNNSGSIQGRGQAPAGTNLAGDGVRVGNPGNSGVSEATIVNSGTINSESAQGTTAGIRFVDGVAFQGTLENSGTISGVQNGLYFGNAQHDGIATNQEDGVISSDSRAVNIDGEGITFNNEGTVVGTASQRNGTVYADGTADNFVVNNSGSIDAGEGNQGSGFGAEIGGAADGVNTFELNNSGSIQGRGQASAAENAAGDGVRIGNPGNSGIAEATIVNSGTISSESAQGTTAGIRFVDGVGFQGTLENSGTISGVQNGLYFGNADHEGGVATNEGIISSDSRAVNLDGDELSFNNEGNVFGTGDQRNGTVYLDGTADNVSVTNSGNIDAGEGNSGSGISTQVGAVSEDAVNENITIVNSGNIDGRGEVLPSGETSGVRFFNGSGQPVATVSGSISNSGNITSETGAGILIESDVAFTGSIENSGNISGAGASINAAGSQGHIDLVNIGNLNGDVILGSGNDSFDNREGVVEGQINLGSGNDEFRGGDGNEIIIGGAGNDQIYGGDGDDILRGGGGSDRTDGGDGIDTADFSDIGSAVTASLEDGEATYLAPNGNLITDQLINIENLLGSDNDDSLTGDDNDNVLTGGLGNDFLDGGEGFDTADFSDVDVPIIVDLDENGNGTVTRETGFSISVEGQPVASLTTEQSPADIVNEAVAGNLYFNIHTQEFNGGEIRGQLSVDSDVTDEAGVRTISLSGSLDASQEPGPTSDSEATGEGSVTLVVAADGTVTYSSELSVTGIQASELLPVAGVSSIHLHNAPAGQNGPVILDVVQDAGGDVNGLAVDPAFDNGDGNVFNEIVETDTLQSIEAVIGPDGEEVFSDLSDDDDDESEFGEAEGTFADELTLFSSTEQEAVDVAASAASQNTNNTFEVA